MERFLTTPLEEREKFEQMKNLNTRLSSNEAIIAKLEKELNDAIAERDADLLLTIRPLMINIILFITIAII
ncbi:unnamed protein product [Rotaria sp. Silwood2]|nr:unnamed protein product [Rotaria sp. Silwood2]